MDSEFQQFDIDQSEGPDVNFGMFKILPNTNGTTQKNRDLEKMSFCELKTFM